MTASTTKITPLTTVAAAANTLCVGQDKIRELIASKKIGHVRIGRSVRIPVSEVERLAKEGTP